MEQNIDSLDILVMKQVGAITGDAYDTNLRLDQVFDASHAIKEILIGQSRLELSYIGSKEIARKDDEVLRLEEDSLPVQRFYSS